MTADANSGKPVSPLQELPIKKSKKRVEKKTTAKSTKKGTVSKDKDVRTNGEEPPQSETNMFPTTVTTPIAIKNKKSSSQDRPQAQAKKEKSPFVSQSNPNEDIDDPFLSQPTPVPSIATSSKQASSQAPTAPTTSIPSVTQYIAERHDTESPNYALVHVWVGHDVPIRFPTSRMPTFAISVHASAVDDVLQILKEHNWESLPPGIAEGRGRSYPPASHPSVPFFTLSECDTSPDTMPMKTAAPLKTLQKKADFMLKRKMLTRSKTAVDTKPNGREIAQPAKRKADCESTLDEPTSKRKKPTNADASKPTLKPRRKLHRSHIHVKGMVKPGQVFNQDGELVLDVAPDEEVQSDYEEMSQIAWTELKRAQEQLKHPKQGSRPRNRLEVAFKELAQEKARREKEKLLASDLAVSDASSEVMADIAPADASQQGANLIHNADFLTVDEQHHPSSASDTLATPARQRTWGFSSIVGSVRNLVPSFTFRAESPSRLTNAPITEADPPNQPPSSNGVMVNGNHTSHTNEERRPNNRAHAILDVPHDNHAALSSPMGDVEMDENPIAVNNIQLDERERDESTWLDIAGADDASWYTHEGRRPSTLAVKEARKQGLKPMSREWRRFMDDRIQVELEAYKLRVIQNNQKIIEEEIARKVEIKLQEERVKNQKRKRDSWPVESAHGAGSYGLTFTDQDFSSSDEESDIESTPTRRSKRARIDAGPSTPSSRTPGDPYHAAPYAGTIFAVTSSGGNNLFSKSIDEDMGVDNRSGSFTVPFDSDSDSDEQNEEVAERRTSTTPQGSPSKSSTSWTQPPPPRPSPQHAALPAPAPVINVQAPANASNPAGPVDDDALARLRAHANRFAPHKPSGLRATSRLSNSSLASDLTRAQDLDASIPPTTLSESSVLEPVSNLDPSAITETSLSSVNSSDPLPASIGTSVLPNTQLIPTSTSTTSPSLFEPIKAPRSLAEPFDVSQIDRNYQEFVDRLYPEVQRVVRNGFDNIPQEHIDVFKFPRQLTYAEQGLVVQEVQDALDVNWTKEDEDRGIAAFQAGFEEYKLQHAQQQTLAIGAGTA
ncbi:hypothetical protein MMC25_007499 [Agyrium rufum]|nr:hypothetical protein [Agyrium rufum]